MVIRLGTDLEAAIHDQARRRGVTVEDLAVETLRERFLSIAPSLQPHDEWERRLIGLSRNCGVSHTDLDLGRDAIYE